MTTPDTAPAPLRSVHSSTFPQLLQELGISVLVSTYQAGKLVILRADGGVLNTHFRNFTQLMGLAVSHGRLACGTAQEIMEFHDVPAVARKLDPAGKHDACFLPRTVHYTGDIQVHELAWGSQPQAGKPELWFVNTRFSCLCTRDEAYSFVPRWRPPFISAVSPEDRCHLNGLAMKDGQPAYVTAHGAHDSPSGWREDKAHGGVVLDVASGEVVCRGLAMPHSPRWYDGRLWVLESGAGSLGTIDLATGKYEPVAVLPGFTRGLDFVGPYAFVGLSQVRESAVFSGIPIAQRPLEERACGVWAVHLPSGRVVAFVKFQDALQEIFAVQLINRVFPDVVYDDLKVLSGSFVVPDEVLAAVPAHWRARTDGQRPPDGPNSEVNTR
jgi:uncharacterized protein (TIGR03032 family)